MSRRIVGVTWRVLRWSQTKRTVMKASSLQVCVIHEHKCAWTCVQDCQRNCDTSAIAASCELSAHTSEATKSRRHFAMDSQLCGGGISDELLEFGCIF